MPTSPFGLYYHRLVDRGMKKGMAVVAVMRKLLIVAAHLIQTQEDYDAGKVGVQAVSEPRGSLTACTPHPNRWAVGDQPLDAVQRPGRMWCLSQGFTILS